MHDVDFNNLNELQEVKSLLAERVIEWTQQWEQRAQKLQAKGMEKGEASLLLRLMELRLAVWTRRHATGCKPPKRKPCCGGRPAAEYRVSRRRRF